jgi:hypothetical protein
LTKRESGKQHFLYRSLYRDELYKNLQRISENNRWLMNNPQKPTGVHFTKHPSVSNTQSRGQPSPSQHPLLKHDPSPHNSIPVDATKINSP